MGLRKFPQVHTQVLTKFAQVRASSRMVRGSSRASSRKFAQVRASSRKFAQVRGQFADVGWFAQVRVSSRTVRASSRAVREVRAHSQLPYTIVHGWFSKFSLMVHKDSQQVHASSHLFSTENLRTYTILSLIRHDAFARLKQGLGVTYFGYGVAVERSIDERTPPPPPCDV